MTFAPPAIESEVSRIHAAPAACGRRERRLILVLVTVAHVAGAVALARLHHSAEPVFEMPIGDTQITVSLIQAVTAIAEAPAASVAPTPPKPAPPMTAPAPAAPPEPVAPPEPTPPPRPEVAPPPEPPPQVVQEPPPKPKPPPPPKKAAVAPKPVTEAPTAIVQEETPPPPSPAAPLTPPAAAALATPAAPSSSPMPVPGPSAPAQPSQNSAPAAVTSARFDAAYLNNPAPAYPPLSRRMREQGRVLLRVFVTAEGRAGRIDLSESSGSSRLDGAAEAAVARWRFVPARQGERDVDAWVIVPIVFKLEG